MDEEEIDFSRELVQLDDDEIFLDPALSVFLDSNVELNESGFPLRKIRWGA